MIEHSSNLARTPDPNHQPNPNLWMNSQLWMTPQITRFKWINGIVRSPARLS
jgi:hypothetical protein